MNHTYAQGGVHVRRHLFASFIFWITLTPVFAQSAAADIQSEDRNELGLTIGGEFIPDVAANGTQLSFSSSVVFGVNYARRLAGTDNTALFLEFPVVAAPSHSVQPTSASPTPVPTSLATLYITPALRVNFARASAISPWFSFGGGYGLYEGSELLSNGAQNPDRFASVGTLQWGGGVDVRTPVKVIFPINLRLEVRDFDTLDSLNFNTGRGTSQHNVSVGGGLLLRW
jgi:hypothetical protein